MITVKFSGLLDLENDKNTLFLYEDLLPPADVTLNQVFEEILKSYPKTSEKKLKQAILFLNKYQLIAKNRLSAKLKSGDELTFLSPASGG